MNSKKKNKNRPKPPKVTPKTDSAESDKPECVDNSEIKVSNIECDKEIISEIKSPDICLPDVEASTEKKNKDEVPKKPERIKNKKQQDTQNEPNTENKLFEEEQNISTVMPTEEIAPVTPKSRKKKNKDKKQNIVEGEIKTEKENKDDAKEEKEIEILETPATVSKEEQDSKMTKKKKKKRNRHDSQKSDIDESVTCNLAFKSLLEVTKDQDSIHPEDNFVLDTSIDSKQEMAIDDNRNTSSENDPITDTSLKIKDQEEHSLKNKKKGKKQKQQQGSFDTCAKTETIEKQVTMTSDLQISLEDSGIKAKIAKPVDRKRKVKTSKESVSDNQTEENVPVNETNFQIQGTDESNKIDVEEIKPDETKDDSKSSEDAHKVKIDELVLCDLKESEKPVSSISENESLACQQSDITIDDSGEDIFTEVKPSKKKKKQKNVSHTGEVTETKFHLEQDISAVQEEDNKKENDEKKQTSFEMRAEVVKTDVTTNITDATSTTSIPDIIQYPRSSSQQLLCDKNISMVIQEIPASEEIKLEIPVCTSVPLVQGSGETPEVKLESDPMRIKLTEIDSKLSKCVEEKTDIKSKMMEVNKDMEELRLSIERSLAELTALDKDDKEFEKNIENKTIDDRCKNETKVTTDISFPMPSTLVEKPASSDNTKTITDIKNLHVCATPEKEIIDSKSKTDDLTKQNESPDNQPPVCPSRKDNKGKSKSKKKNKQEITAAQTASSDSKPSTSEGKSTNESSKEQKNEKSENTGKSSQEKGKQQSLHEGSDAKVNDESLPMMPASTFEPIENFEDALTSSVDDVNTTFEMIANELMNSGIKHQPFENPEINIIAPTEDENNKNSSKDKQVTPPKNLLGHPDIPVPSNKTDYKKEKNKLPNNQQAKVKIKDSVDVEKKEKVSKQSQTCVNKNDSKYLKGSESFSYMTNGNNEFVYKYSFRKVFLQSYCHVCKRELVQRFPCKFCSLIFYCSQKHIDEDWPRHQPLCFAVSTISHLKDQKHVYADAKGITGQDYRVLRMQMIVSCEKILKRKLVPWEQEALLYPRICADSNCREWIQSKLKDCKGCEQISYCSDHEDHLPTEHLRWCKSYALYKKLVNYQQTKGRLEPPMPTKILENYVIPEKINDVLASMYEEKIDMNDIQYAALTQLATAPLTVAYSYQIFTNNNKNIFLKKTSFTVHVVGAELQFEADGLNKWEVFLLHLRPEIKDLRIVLVNPDLNPSKLPLDLLGKAQLCENCKANKRRVIFSFQDKLTYHAYYSSDDFITPDIVCAFNPSIQRSSIYNGKDSWPSSTKCILKQKVPFVITSYTLDELKRDLERIREFCDIAVVVEPKPNPFASVRPDRNFITDHEIPLLFKNYCLSMVCAA